MDMPEHIRAKIRVGRLPRPPTWRIPVWASTGKGHLCSGCDRPITPADFESEVEDLGLRFHKACFDVWTLGLGSE
jgi:hypothetical protein